MIKFLLGIAIVAFTSFCGYLLAKRYRQRKAFFEQLKVFNERFLNEITYYRRPLKEFASAYAYRGEFNELLQDLFRAWDERTTLENVVSGLPKYTFLTEEERRLITDYFSMLGRGDSRSQKGYFAGVNETLAKKQTETENEAKRYGDLYIKIGFLCGLFILILIV